jgi:hypothetical protein
MIPLSGLEEVVIIGISIWAEFILDAEGLNSYGITH